MNGLKGLLASHMLSEKLWRLEALEAKTKEPKEMAELRIVFPGGETKSLRAPDEAPS